MTFIKLSDVVSKSQLNYAGAYFQQSELKRMIIYYKLSILKLQLRWHIC